MRADIKTILNSMALGVLIAGPLVIMTVPSPTYVHHDHVVAEYTMEEWESIQTEAIKKKEEQTEKQTEIVAEQEEINVLSATAPTVNEEEVDLLAHLIYAEVGSIKADECLYACGSVVLNRVAAVDFPNSIREVIYQTVPALQYACIMDGNIEMTPDERCYRIARELLIYGSTLPEDVIYQAEFIQGSGVYEIFENMIYSWR